MLALVAQESVRKHQGTYINDKKANLHEPKVRTTEHRNARTPEIYEGSSENDGMQNMWRKLLCVPGWYHAGNKPKYIMMSAKNPLHPKFFHNLANSQTPNENMKN